MDGGGRSAFEDGKEAVSGSTPSELDAQVPGERRLQNLTLLIQHPGTGLKRVIEGDDGRVREEIGFVDEIAGRAVGQMVALEHLQRQRAELDRRVLMVTMVTITRKQTVQFVSTAKGGTALVSPGRMRTPAKRARVVGRRGTGIAERVDGSNGQKGTPKHTFGHWMVPS